MTGTPEQGRRDAEKRWAKYRADRIARGLPPTVREERGRKPDRFTDPDERAHWEARADEAGLFGEKATATQRHLIAYRFAQASAAELAQQIAARGADATLSSVDERIAYYEAELRRLDAADAADAMRAKDRADYRAEIENALADIHFLEGRVS
ncbi:hypothetical protein [Microbacterium sp. NPDC055521]